MATFELVLYEGKNAVSIPLQLEEEDAKWKTILAGIAFNSVQTVTDGLWKNYIRGRTSDLNDFDSAEPTKGYLVDIVRIGTTPEISGLLPNTLELVKLDIGDQPFSDLAFVIKEIPLQNQSSLWIKMVQADYADTSSVYLTFTTDRVINVSVAYDGNATSFPGWLANWQDTERFVVIDDLSYRVFRKTFPVGSVNLPGNQNSGGDGAAQYVVMIDENTYPIYVNTPAVYQVGKLDEGMRQYTDSTVYLTDIPEAVETLDWIKFPNAGYTDTTLAYADFTLPDEADVYVGYDSSVAQPPEWLTEFDALDSFIVGTNGTYRLFKKYFSAGSVTLGGASAATPPDPDTPFTPGPNATPGFNYIVLVRRLNPSSVTITLEGAEPDGINVLPLVGTNKGGLNFIGFPKAIGANSTITHNITDRITEYTQILRLNKQIWESYVPTRDETLNWYPAELERGLGYLLITSKAEDEELEIDYDG